MPHSLRRRTHIIAAGLAALGVLPACSDSGSGLEPSTGTERFEIVAASGGASVPGLAGKTLSLAPGDTARLSGLLSSSTGGSQTATGVTWSVADVSIADVDGSGLVRAKANGATSLVARTSRVADTLSLVVSACGSVPTLNMSVGQVLTYGGNQGGDLCADGGTAGAEFTLIAYNADSANVGVTAKTASLMVAGAGIGELSADLGPLTPGGLALSRTVETGLDVGTPALRRDVGFDLRLRRAAAALAPRMAAARAARERATSGASAGTPGRMARSVTAAAWTVGQLVTLNTGLEPCDTTKSGGLNRRVGRVVAITDKAYVVADTGNPAGGFTMAQYEAYGAAFDTLAYPVDIANFGEPVDVDKNGKSIIFFTRAVNAMTPRNADYYIGGFFYERDLFPNTFGLSEKDGGCGASNYAEMFYMLVPDPNGTINGNRRTAGFVDSVTVGTLGHEFQHLINASRRVYVNDADDWEDVWLGEGLSHIAEELVFYRAAGNAPRLRLTSDAIRASDKVRNAFNVYAKGNFERLLTFQDSPEAASLYADDDELETRGATWQFLRYAADRVNGDDAALWRKLVATTKVWGQRNLQAALGVDGATLANWYRDFAVANYADALVTGLNPTYAYRSWNFRDVVGGFRTSRGTQAFPVYPLATHTLAAGFPQTAQVRGGSAAYFRFAVPANKQATVRTRGVTGATAMAGTMRLAVVRTR